MSNAITTTVSRKSLSAKKNQGITKTLLNATLFSLQGAGKVVMMLRYLLRVGGRKHYILEIFVPTFLLET